MRWLAAAGLWLALAPAALCAKEKKEPPSPVVIPRPGAKGPEKGKPAPAKKTPAAAPKGEEKKAAPQPPAVSGAAAAPAATGSGAAPAAKPVPVSIGEVLGARKAFDNKPVRLRCIVRHINATTSHRGHPYFTFDCDDATAQIRVFCFGFSKVGEGDTALVEGVFRETSKVGQYTFHDEIAADKVTREEVLPQAVTPAHR